MGAGKWRGVVNVSKIKTNNRLTYLHFMDQWFFFFCEQMTVRGVDTFGEDFCISFMIHFTKESEKCAVSMLDLTFFF